MKRTYSANIDGKLFNIDDDAYALLSDYLHQLHSAFTGDEGNEIVTDIEARIAELFGERVSRGRNVITLADVNVVIETMGRPCDLTDMPDGDHPTVGDAESAATDTTEPGTVPPPYNGADAPVGRRLYRDVRHKLLGGVLSGLSCYLNWDVWVMRGLFLALMFMICSWWPYPFDRFGWVIVIAYLVCWMIIPPATTRSRELEMKGEPVTVGTIGRSVLENSSKIFASRGTWSGTLESTSRMVGRALAWVIGVAALAGLIAALVVGTIGTVALINLQLSDGENVAELLRIEPGLGGTMMCLCMILWSLAAIVPLVGVLWASCTSLFKVSSLSKATIVTATVIDILLIVSSIVVTILTDRICQM